MSREIHAGSGLAAVLCDILPGTDDLHRVRLCKNEQPANTEEYKRLVTYKTGGDDKIGGGIAIGKYKFWGAMLQTFVKKIKNLGGGARAPPCSMDQSPLQKILYLLQYSTRIFIFEVAMEIYYSVKIISLFLSGTSANLKKTHQQLCGCPFTKASLTNMFI